MFKKLRLASEKPIFTLLGMLENMLSATHTLRNAPTFIIGPPRSGTTLLGQMVCHALDVSYIPNLAIRMRKNYIKRPPVVLATWLAKILGYTENKHETYESYYGSSTNLGGSSDSDFIWRNVLPMGYLYKGTLNHQQKRYIYRITSGIEKIFEYRPFVDKCVGHSLRIPELIDIFPDVLFVRCRRNPLSVAQSVYFGRTRNEQARNTWLTPHARGFDKLFKKNLLEQCAGQQNIFDKDIDEGLAELPEDRWIEVDYDNVCTQPQIELERVMALMNRHGIEVQQTHRLPDNFPHSNYRRVNKDVYEDLIKYLEVIYGAPVVRLREPV